MYQLYQIQLHKKNKLFSYFNDICTHYKELYNVTNFYIRQCMTGMKKSPELRYHNETEVLHMVFNHLKSVNALRKGKPFPYPKEDNWFLSYGLLDGIFKVTKNEVYYALPAQVNQNAIKDCINNWLSYFAALKDYKQSPFKYTGKPNLVTYKKQDKMTATFTNINCKIRTNKNGKSYLTFPKTKQTLNLGNLDFSDKKLIEVSVKPFANSFEITILYEVQTAQDIIQLDSNRILGIDLGVNNIATLSNNFGESPILIKGGAVKACNQYYNKQMGAYHSLLRMGKKPKEGQYSSHRIAQITKKRNNYIKDYFHKISKKIIAYCLEHKIGVIVIGKNNHWKTGCNMGSITNQSFTQIPHSQLIANITYLAERYGIQVIEQEESYTSKASFLDKDNLPVYHKGITGYVFSGKRIYRGLYKTQDGTLLNADINGACNIIRKAIITAFSHMTDYEYLKQPVVWNAGYLNQ